jgi:glucose dehydrogenase
LVSAEAQRIELDSLGKPKRVVYLAADGREQAVEAPKVVVATQAVEAVRLLLNSATQSHPQGLANGNGVLGRYFMEHPKFYVSAKVKQRLNPYKQGFETCTTFKYHDHPNRGDYAGGRLLVRENAGPAPHDVALTSGRWGRALREEVVSLFGHAVTLGAFLEQLPRAENRITLSETVKQRGLPAARVDFNLVEQYEQRGYEQMRDVMLELLDAIGATEAHTAMKPSNSGHYMGGHRMGANPDTSTTDSWLETHEIKGLYLATGGAFPTAGVSNPTLTTVALCLRMAAQILAS